MRKRFIFEKKSYEKRIYIIIFTVFICSQVNAQKRVLYYVDYILGTDRMAQALSNAGYSVTQTSNNSTFQTLISTPSNYDLAIYFAQGGGPDNTSVAALSNFVTTYNKEGMYADWSNNNTAGAYVGVQYTGNTNMTNILITDANYAANVSANPVTISNAGWGVFSTGMTVNSGGRSIAKFTSNNETAIASTLNNRMLVFGFLNDALPSSENYESAFDLFCGITKIASSNNPSSIGCRNCAELTVTAGGSGLRYTWSNNDTLATTTVCPTSTTTYKVVMTGAGNCLDSATFTQNVIDARSPYPNTNRVYMCQYQTSRKRWYTISPYTTQITQLLAGGSKCGACNKLPKRNGDISFEGIEEIYSIFPNPAQNQITVESYNLNSEEITIELVDMTGRVVLNVFNGFVMEGEFTQVTADISNLPTGMYFMRYSSQSDLRVDKVQVVR